MNSYSVFVGTVGQGLIRIKDGEKWQRVGYTGRNSVMHLEAQVRGLAFDPHDKNLMYCGDEQGIYRSTDGGATWKQLHGAVDGYSVWTIAIDPNNSKIIFAGARPGAFFRSKDGGDTWEKLKAAVATECQIGVTRVTKMAIDPLDSRHVWATVEIGGVWRSLDGGDTWTMPKSGIEEMDQYQDIHNMTIIPGTQVAQAANGRSHIVRGMGSTVLIVCQYELVASSDNGETWHSIAKKHEIPTPYMRGLAIKPDDPTTLFMGIGNQALEPVGKIIKSTDGGLSWQELPLPLQLNSGPYNVAVHPSNPNRIWVGTIFGQILHTEDAGQTWEKFPREITEIRNLAWRPD